MTSINIPKDDIAVREARSQNSNTPAVQALKETAQITPTEPIKPHQPIQPPRTAIRQRGKKDRRQGERRKQQINVLLDTRNHRERRKKSRRNYDMEAIEEKPTGNRRGIDEYT